ncbi:hypothetical protein SRHO_G00295920 [Serrasalmus rhombeus]
MYGVWFECLSSDRSDMVKLDNGPLDSKPKGPLTLHGCPQPQRNPRDLPAGVAFCGRRPLRWPGKLVCNQLIKVSNSRDLWSLRRCQTGPGGQ